MKKILVPTDFSDTANAALSNAVDIARRSDGEIILLHVIELPLDGSFNAEGEIGLTDGWEDKLFVLKLIERAKKKLNDIAATPPLKGVRNHAMVRVGNSFHGIREVIVHQPADLVVIGSKGKSGWVDALVGSNAQKVVRTSACPVLTVHDKSRVTFENIVYATSMNENELAFGEIVRNTQQMYGCKIQLVRINTPFNFQPDHVSIDLLQKFAKRLNLQNYTVNVFSDLSEEEGIRNFAKLMNADLIAMATHGRRGLTHLIAGSIAEEVVNHSRLPVLTHVVHTGI